MRARVKLTLCSSTKPYSINPQPLYGRRVGTKQSGVKLQSQPSALSTSSGEGKMEETRVEDVGGWGMNAWLPSDMCVYVDVMLGRSSSDVAE